VSASLDGAGAGDPLAPQGGALTGNERMLAAIRQAILAGELFPSQRLVEADLAEQFSGSRGAVRAALIRLEDEGIVERTRHRGATVRVVRLQEAIELTEARMVLESLCAAMAADRVTDAEVTELQLIGAQMAEAVRRHEDVRYSELNRRLHERIVTISGHGVAQELINRLRGRSGVTHQFRLALHPRRLDDSLREHLDLVDAVSRRDGAAASEAMRRHLEAVRATLSVRESLPGSGDKTGVAAAAAAFPLLGATATGWDV
jgi:DNA-binding GntR family transcriptional regulator